MSASKIDPRDLPLDPNDLGPRIPLWFKPDYFPSGILPGDPPRREDESDDDEWTFEESERYHEQVTESDGFDVEHIRASGMMSIIHPLDWDDDIIDKKAGAELAINAYKARKGRELQFVEVVNCTRQFGCLFNYYLTFKAKDLSEDKVDIYQAVLALRVGFEWEVLSFRRKPSGGPKKWFWYNHFNIVCQENDPEIEE